MKRFATDEIGFEYPQVTLFLDKGSIWQYFCLYDDHHTFISVEVCTLAEGASAPGERRQSQGKERVLPLR